MSVLVDLENRGGTVREVPGIEFLAGKAIKLEARHLEVAQKMIISSVLHHEDDIVLDGTRRLAGSGNVGEAKRRDEEGHYQLHCERIRVQQREETMRSGG